MRHFSRLGLTFALFCLLFVGCGSSNNFVVDNTDTSPGNLADGGQTATITLQSELILNRAVSSTISTIQVTTKSSSGTTLFQSTPIPKTPVIKVEVPVDSKHLQLDYLDSSANVLEIWGSPLPDLRDGDQITIRQTNPDPLANLTRLEILGPSRIPTGLTQFRAQATYSDNSVRDVTNSVTWGPSVRPDGVADTTNQIDHAIIRITATFGGLTANKSVETLALTPQGLPFLLSGPSVNDAPVKDILLNGCGEIRQLFVYSNFSDGIVREVTPGCGFSNLQPRIYLADRLGRVQSVGQGSTSIRISFARNILEVPLQVIDNPAQAVFGNPRESSQTLTGTAGPMLVQDMNADGLGDLITFASSSGGIDVTKVQIALGNGSGKFSAPTSVSLPFSNETGVRPLVFGSTTTRPNSSTNILTGPFLAVGCSNSNTLAVITRGRSGFTTQTYVLDGPVSEISMVPFCSDTTTRERLLVRSTSGSVRLVEVGSSGSSVLTIPDLKPEDKLIAIHNGRENAVVRGTTDQLKIHRFVLGTGTTLSSASTVFLPSGSTLLELRSVVDSKGLGFDALVQSGSTRSLLRYQRLPDALRGLTDLQLVSQVSGLPATTTLTPYNLNCGSERIFNIATASTGSPNLVLDSNFTPLTGLSTLQSNPFAVGDLNADGFDDLVVLESGNLRTLLLGP